MKFVAHLQHRTWKAVIAEKWWQHQQQALEMVGDYLAATTDQQAMVRMPTGTGKTLVIATLARLLKEYPRVLVVVPWENLVRQLSLEIESRIWVKLGEYDALPARSVLTFTPTSLSAVLKQLQGTGVLVCTYQTLQAVYKKNSAFQSLRKWTTLTLVDEGHREPAPRWAEAIRDLEQPTVLFTATPYRNDLQLFNVNVDYFSSYTFDEALEQHIVRKVDFIDGTWTRGSANTVKEFVTKLLAARDSIQAHLGLNPGTMRVIVRCTDAANIKAVATELQTRGETVVGVHERFKSADGTMFRKEVPDPQVETATFWMHQNKLLEGIDDPAFRLVAIFDRFSNGRNLVQQIGRVIRNPAGTANQKAFVLAHQQDRQKDLWNRFLEYEKEVRTRKAAGHAELSAFDEFVASYAHAPRFYLLGDFRRHLRADEISDPRDEVRMRKSVLVRVPRAGFKWNKLVFGIQKELLTQDAVGFGPAFQDKNTYLQLFQIFEQSDVVVEAYMEIRLGYVFAKRIGSHVFFFDTEGRSPEHLRSATQAVAPELLHRLLPDEKTIVKEVSLINGDFGNRAFRRRSISMDSLQIVPPALSDYVQVCSTATGSVRTPIAGKDETRRRYVGFTYGRLSERTTPVLPYNEFEEWLDSIDADLDNDAITGEDTLSRFAKPHKYDDTEEARHILFDITSETIDASKLSAATVSDPDNLWVVHKGTFQGEVDDKPFAAHITFNRDTERFEIDSSDLDQVMLTDSGTSLSSYLNETQNFRVLLGTSTVYTQGKFFTPNLLPWRGGGHRLNIQRIVIGCGGLKGIHSEKGDIAGWSHDSVFGAVTEKAKVFAAANWMPEILVCNDVGSPEIADFFALSEADNRMAMIHCKKARLNSKMSASAFHDVCSQAVRYLGFFNSTDTVTKLTAAQVGGTWCPDPAEHPQLKRLVWANGNPTPAAVVKKFTSAIQDATCQREVWLVMGNGLSQKAFEQAVSKTNPKPHEREMSYLLQSTWCASASVGAALKVFCMP
jgi:superfamily II DNA or RNA helicase